MSTNYQSLGLQQTPGYAPPTDFTVQAPSMPTLPALPSMPAIDDARSPGAAGRQILQTRLGQLPVETATQTNLARQQAEAGLVGLGGWRWVPDDPSTPQREDLIPVPDRSGPLGERERSSVIDQRSRGASRGMLYSTSTNQGIGSALQRLSDEGRQVVTKYASALNGIYSAAQREGVSLTSEWARLYGEDARFLADNPLASPDYQQQLDQFLAPEPAAAPAPAQAPRRPALPRRPDPVPRPRPRNRADGSIGMRRFRNDF